MFKIFTAELVSKGHPDKVADQISDAVLDMHLSVDPDAHVACETLVTENAVVLAGEVLNHAQTLQSAPNVLMSTEKAVRQAIVEAGYPASDPKFGGTVTITNNIHEQSADLYNGLKARENQAAGDQGIVFGYACDRGPEYMPMEFMVAREILHLLDLNREYFYPILKADAKCLVSLTIDEKGYRVKNIVLSCQHEYLSDVKDLSELQELVFNGVVFPAVQAFLPGIQSKDVPFQFNPLGFFNEGGPAADTGLTGRKIMVDTYGSSCPHGGGAFSGKDPSKVDRSGAYYARYIAKNLVAAGIAHEVVVQISFVPGHNASNILQIDTRGTNLTNIPDEDLPSCLGIDCVVPGKFIEDLHLRAPIYQVTAKQGHFGFVPYNVTKSIRSTLTVVRLYPWEELDLVDTFRLKLNTNKTN